MKKNLKLKFVMQFLVITFIVNMPGSVYSMDTIRSKAQWVKTKAAKAKEKTLDRLVKQYRATQEFRRKKAAGTATPAELAKLKRQMKTIKIAAAAIGITLAAIAAIAGGTYAYSSYKKGEQERQRFLSVLAQSKKEMESREKKRDEVNIDQIIEEATTEAKKADVVALILANQAPSERDEGLRRAVKEESVKAIDIYLKAKADPNASYGYYPSSILGMAIRKENPTIVQMLIDAGAHVRRGAEGNFLVVVAAQFKNPDVVEVLAKAGADLNAKGYKRQTPLIIAADRGNEQVVRRLLDFGADINVSDADGHSALYYAILANSSDIVRLLLKRGINRSPEDLSPADEAMLKVIARSEMRVANPALMGLPAEVRMRIGEKVGVETPWTP